MNRKPCVRWNARPISWTSWFYLLPKGNITLTYVNKDHKPTSLFDRSASPGKLAELEDELFRSAEMSETPVVMAVTLALVDGARTVRLRQGSRTRV